MDAARNTDKIAVPEYPSGTVAFLFTDIEGRHGSLGNRPPAHVASRGAPFDLLRGDRREEAFISRQSAMPCRPPSVRPDAVAAAVAGQHALASEDSG